MSDLISATLWFVEFRRDVPLDLGEIARREGVSPYHLSRAFAAGTGWSVMRYRRARRLTEAARALARGGPILEVALDAGYGSHEAFTRAFRDLFGHPPSRVRSPEDLTLLTLVESLDMPQKTTYPLAPPRFEQRDTFTVVGLSERYSFDAIPTIPALWTRFNAVFDHVPHKLCEASFGVCYDGTSEEFTYMAGVEVTAVDDLPEGMTSRTIAVERYAVFTHDGRISDLRQTVHAIWTRGLKEAGVSAAPAPDFEFYDDRFDAATGRGQVEIWIPVGDA